MSMDLSISRIYGTSSNGPLTMVITSDLVAYIASGGVVVSNITTDSNNVPKLSNQRFFCATQNKIIPSNNLSRTYSTASPEITSKDAYGIPKPSTPVIIKENMNSSDIYCCSPPKPSPQQPYSNGSQASARLKTVSAIAISPDGKLLALGETGNQPRIHIFSLAPDSNNTPIITIIEHGFGVHALRFSPNSQNLLSLGLPHDGFLYVWKMNGLQIDCIAVNKCTSVVNGVNWINDEDFITYGIRHVKFWKLEELTERSREVLQGKSVILGDFINCNFVYLNIVDFDEGNLLFFLSATGDICWYSPEENSLKLKYKFPEGKKIGAILIDYDLQKLWYGDDDSAIKSISIEEVDQYDIPQTKFDGNIDSPSKSKFTPNISLLRKLDNNSIFFATGDDEIKYYDITSGKSFNATDSLLKSNTGLKIASNNEIINWTKNGQIQRINKETFDLEFITEVELVDVPNKVIDNHITALDITTDNEILIGDAYGNLSIYSINGELIFTTQAHEFSVNDVSFFEIDGVKFIVSIGRDRMIQVFGKTLLTYIEDVTANWNILQTLDCHKGNLLKLCCANENRVYTSSADRSITIHEFKIEENKVIIDKLKTISLKSTPSTIFVHENELFISSIDKQMVIYDTKSLDTIKTFKVHDLEMESLLVDNISITSQGYLLCSCSDKTVRVFNYNAMKQLAANWGHSEPIKSLVLYDCHVITLSSNGCLFKWTLTTDSGPSTIQRYNELTPKVIRKIKNSSTPSSSPSPVRKLHPMSPNRSPNTASKLQPTARGTPSKLTSTVKTNLLPSPSLKNKISTPTSTTKRLSPSVKVTPNLSPSTKSYNPKLSSLKPTALTSPITKGRSVLSDKSIPNDKDADNENKVNIDELLSLLKRFKDNIGDYSYEQVSQVKREVGSLFDVENDLLKRYSKLLIEDMKQFQ